MKTDIQERLKDYGEDVKLPKDHTTGFAQKLDAELPDTANKRILFLRIAAVMLFLLGIGYFMKPYPEKEQQARVEPLDVKDFRLTEISPELKKIETYYITVFNYELARMQLDKVDKKTLKKYFDKLAVLTEEYKMLDAQKVPDLSDEELINRLIDNLQQRLKLLIDLRNEIHNTKNKKHENRQL